MLDHEKWSFPARSVGPAQAPSSLRWLSIDSPPKIRSNNITTPDFSLFSLNPPTKLAESKKLARALNPEGSSLPVTPVDSTVPRRRQRTRNRPAAWDSTVPKYSQISASPASRSLAASRRSDCCSVGYGCAFQLPSAGDPQTAAEQLKCLIEKQSLSRGVQNINSHSGICVRSSKQRHSVDCSASPASGSKSGAAHLTAPRENSFAQPLLQLTKAISSLVLKSQSRLPDQESSREKPQFSKISAIYSKRNNLQEKQPGQSGVFFGYCFEPSESSRPSSPDFLEPQKRIDSEKVNTPALTKDPNQAIVASPPPEGGRIGGSVDPHMSRPGFQGDVVLLRFLCPERPDIAAQAQTHGLTATARDTAQDEADDAALEDMDMDDIEKEMELEDAPVDEQKGAPSIQERNGNDNSPEGNNSVNMDLEDAPVDEEEGAPSNEEREGNDNSTDSNSSNGRSNGANGQPAPAGSVGGDGSSGGTGGGGGGGERPPTKGSHEMDVDIKEEEVEVKKEAKEDENGGENEISQDQRNRLSSIAIEAVQRTHNGDAANSPNRHHAPPPTDSSRGSTHSPPGQVLPGSHPDISMSTLPGISTSPQEISTKPTLPSLSSALKTSIPQLQQLADLAIQQHQGSINTSQGGPFSPAQSVVSTTGSQRSSDTPQPAPLSPPASTKAQAGYGSDGARKPLHHMTVQERASFVHSTPTAPPYYSPMQYQYPPLNEDIHTNGVPPNIPGSPYPPAPQHVYAQGRELPSLNYQPAAPYHYPHEISPSAEPQPLRTGPAANMFAQPQYEEHAPSGPSTADTIPSMAGSDDTIAAPQMPTPKRNSTGNRDGPAITGTFRCEYPNCQAPPFQTQYLLNSHANVHSVARPHFCPIPGCPRGEKGRGFKRKNEAIRHGLVHESPGYVCPFCPDREHKYPRPDNLQRHVRVHHTDKSKDDPQLREVLSQRPEGGTRGRRRRGGG